ncbi:methyl-accepting chemotaxis protein [Bacillus sp. AK128]
MKWTVGKKLYAGFLSILLIMGGLGVLSIVKMSDINDRSTEIKENWLPSVQYVLEAKGNLEKLVALELKHVTSTDEDVMAEYEIEITETTASINDSLQLYEPLLTTDKEKELFNDFQKEFEEFNLVHIEVIDSSRNNDNVKAAAKVKEAEQQYSEMIGKLDELVEINQTGAASASDQGDVEYAQARTLIIMFIAISLILGVGIAFFLTRGITRPLIRVTENLQLVADGDLRVNEIEVKGKDEVATLTKSFNAMVTSLKEIVYQLSSSASNLASSSEEISASTEEIASGSQQQANEASSAAEMVKEMASAVENVTKNAESTSQSAESTVDAANRGQHVVQETLEGMKLINERITELSNKSIQIGDILQVIDEIAEQTNLLALNAAIEAARAGESGKGFSVVADEVRKLAERSKNATKEISVLIQSIQSNTKETVDAVNQGNEKTNNVGMTFNEIVLLVKKSAQMVAEIAAASEEQMAQSQEVLLATQNIAAVSEETAAGVEQTAATSTELAKMAEALNMLAARFKL